MLSFDEHGWPVPPSGTTLRWGSNEDLLERLVLAPLRQALPDVRFTVSRDHLSMCIVIGLRQDTPVRFVPRHRRVDEHAALSVQLGDYSFLLGQPLPAPEFIPGTSRYLEYRLADDATLRARDVEEMLRYTARAIYSAWTHTPECTAMEQQAQAIARTSTNASIATELMYEYDIVRPEQIAALQQQLATMNAEVARLRDAFTVTWPPPTNSAAFEQQKQADARAEKLLNSLLTEEQREERKKLRRFHVMSQFKRRYRIMEGRTQNIRLLDDRGEVEAAYCVNSSKYLPLADELAMQVLLLKANEAQFLRIANRFDMRRS